MLRPLFILFFSVVKRMILWSLALVSPMTFAIGDKLARQDSATLELLAYIALGIIAFLFLLTIIGFRRRPKVNAQPGVTHKVVSKKDEFLDRMNSGLMLVGLKGNILEVNDPSAKLLGRQKSRLLNQSISRLFDDDSNDAIKRAIGSSESTKLVVNAPSSNMSLRMTINKQASMYKGVAFVVSLEDVNQYESSIKQITNELNQLNTLTDQIRLGQMTVDFENETFKCNQILSKILGENEEISGNFDALHKLICPNAMANWKHAFEIAREQHEFDFNCVFQANESKVALKVSAISSRKNQKGKSVAFKLLTLDETKGRQNQRREHTSEQKSITMLNVSMHPMYLLDEECRIIATNNAFERLFGLRFAEIKNKRFDLLKLVPENINVLHNPERTPVTIGRAFNKDFTCRLPKAAESNSISNSGERTALSDVDDTVEAHLRVTIQAFGDDKNERAGFAGMIQDLTLITQTQRQLESERAHFSNLLDIGPIAVAIIDSENKIVRANPAMTERLGLNEKELKQGTFYELFDDTDTGLQAAKKLHETGRLREFHTQLKGKNDLKHPSELHIDLFDRDNEQYLCWISDRSGEQLQEDKFLGLLRHSSMPMAILNEKGFANINPAACEFFGAQSEEDLQGSAPYSSKLNKDDGDADELKRIVNKVKYDGRAKTLNWQHKAGRDTRHCQATYIPIYKGKEFDSILCMWTDLTEIIQADEARVEAINAHKRAEREVAENQQMLRTSHEQLATKLKDLRDTETKLQLAQDEISEAKIEYITLQEKHQNVSDNLQKVQGEYSQSKELLNEAQKVNNTLTEQLVLSTQKVDNLQSQRNDITSQLQLSEKNFEEAQIQLEASKANSKQLELQQQQQQEKMQAYVTQIESLKQSITNKDAEISEVGSQITGLQAQLHTSDNASAELKEALIAQRKASEEAESQRREIENTYKLAQSELTNKVRYVEHLQNEMQKFEEMSKQEKGDMAAQQSKLMKELEDRQQVLKETQQALDEAKQVAEREKLDKQRQQEQTQRVEAELREAEQHAQRKFEEMRAAEEMRRSEQQKLQEELLAKQQMLMDTERTLSEAKQQTEAEKADKLRQQALFDKLQAEFVEFEKHSAEQQAKIAESGKQWEEHQAELTKEVDAKRKELQDSQLKLNEIQQQADAEKLARIEKERKVEQLSVELSDVESRATKQKEMLEGGDEQWSEHHQQIEEQKKQLQEALANAQKQNQSLQEKLEGNLSELQQAESQVSQTQTAEHQLQEDLNAAKRQQEELESRIKQQEQQELALKKQVEEQQATLLGRERSIQTMEQKQEALMAELQAVQEEYSQSKQSLSEQQSNQSGLSEQLAALEEELKSSKAQLDDKEQALQQAQEQLQTNEQSLAEQEGALVAAHKEELLQAKQQMKVEEQGKVTENSARSALAQMPMPKNPSSWFDLLPYLQKQGQVDSLSTALNELIEELETAITATEEAVKQDKGAEIIRGARRLVQSGKKVNADALVDLVKRLDADCSSGMVDNISIAWPITKQSFTNTLRVIFENLHG